MQDNNLNYSSFIKVSQAYSRSVNVKYDWDNHDKISSFIPTIKSAEILEQILDSLNDENKTSDLKRSNILVGSYGTGKSHLTLLLSYILRNDKNKKVVLKPILEKINNLSSALRQKILDFIDKKYLIVNISGNLESFEKILMLSLKEALKNEKLDEKINLKTKFDAAIKKINNWKELYPEQFDNFINEFNKALSNKKNTNADHIISELKILNSKYYEVFLKVYSKLTYGSNFDENFDIAVTDIYREVSEKIKKYGYEGIIVIFDEFGKYFEKYASKVNSNFSSNIQDFAEMCNKSSELNINLLLITHQEISQYANNLSVEFKNEWLKVEGRFNHFFNIDTSGKIYEMIASIITNENMEVTKIVSDGLRTKINKYEKLFSNYIKKDNILNIIKRCFPIEPHCLLALPFLSNKLAQNERTIFTFLCNDEENSFQNFIKDNKFNEKNCLDNTYGCSNLYDYFEELIKKDNKLGGNHIIWKKVQIALQKIANLENTEILKKIIKTLAIIMIVNEYKLLPPTAQSIEDALNITEDIDDYLKILAENKIFIKSVKNGYYRFIEGSNIDISKEIDKYYDKDYEYYNILNEKFMPSLCLPKQHNELNFINRYLVCYYAWNSKLSEYFDYSNIMYDLESKKCNGIVFYCISENEHEQKEIIKTIKKFEKLSSENELIKNIVFIVSENNVELKKLLINYYSLDLMIKDKELTDKDELVTSEISDLIEDYSNLIEENLRKAFFDVKTEKRFFHCNFKEHLNYYQSYQLNQNVSRICDELYSKTPKVNYELVNKNHLSTQMLTSFKNIFKVFYYQGKKEITLPFSPKSSEISILKCVFKANGLLNLKLEQKELTGEINSLDNPNIPFEIKDCLNEMTEFFKSCEHPKAFSKLYYKLKMSPYGLKDGLILYFLFYVLYNQNLIHSLFFKEKNEDGEYKYIEHYNAETLIKLIDEPENYEIEFSNEIYKNIEDAEWFINNIIKLNRLQNFLNNDNDKDIYAKIAVSISNWYFSIPKYVRECEFNEKNEDYKLINLIKISRTNSKRFILTEIPKVLKINKFSKVLKKLEEIFDSFSSQIDVLKAKIVENTKKAIAQKINNNESFISLIAILKLVSEINNKNIESEETLHFIKEVKKILTKKDITDIEAVNIITKFITGLSIVDWNILTEEEYYKKLNNILDDLSGSTSFNNNKKTIKIHVENWQNNQLTINFKDSEVSSMGELAKSNLKSVLDDYNQSISLNEKRKILMSLLLESANEEKTCSNKF